MRFKHTHTHTVLASFLCCVVTSITPEIWMDHWCPDDSGLRSSADHGADNEQVCSRQGHVDVCVSPGQMSISGKPLVPGSMKHRLKCLPSSGQVFVRCISGQLTWTSSCKQEVTLVAAAPDSPRIPQSDWPHFTSFGMSPITCFQ